MPWLDIRIQPCLPISPPWEHQQNWQSTVSVHRRLIQPPYLNNLRRFDRNPRTASSPTLSPHTTQNRPCAMSRYTIRNSQSIACSPPRWFCGGWLLHCWCTNEVWSRERVYLRRNTTLTQQQFFDEYQPCEGTGATSTTPPMLRYTHPTLVHAEYIS